MFPGTVFSLILAVSTHSVPHTSIKPDSIKVTGQGDSSDCKTTSVAMYASSTGLCHIPYPLYAANPAIARVPAMKRENAFLAFLLREQRMQRGFSSLSSVVVTFNGVFIVYIGGLRSNRRVM